MKRSLVEQIACDRKHFHKLQFKMNWKRQEYRLNSKRTYRQIYCKNGITEPTIWF